MLREKLPIDEQFTGNRQQQQANGRHAHQADGFKARCAFGFHAVFFWRFEPEGPSINVVFIPFEKYAAGPGKKRVK
jgi:hypothetical protein